MPPNFLPLLDDITTRSTADSLKRPAVSLAPISAASTSADKNTQHGNTSVSHNAPETVNNFLELTASADRASNDNEAPSTASKPSTSTSGQ